MATINRHIWPGSAGSRCSICGTVRRDESDAGSPLSCIDRIAERAEQTGRRIIACEDIETISIRLSELRAERDAILATTPEEQTLV